jgi:death on curing protein
LSDPDFLTLAEVVAAHSDQIARYGGESGIRDMGLLESALAQPQASFGGELLHKTLWDMGAAYAFHICQNHPFFDGNKRTALAAALLFLDMNGIILLDPKSFLIDALYRVAKGELDKSGLAAILRKLPSKKNKP